jgi:hypothetical protein
MAPWILMIVIWAIIIAVIFVIARAIRIRRNEKKTS